MTETGRPFKTVTFSIHWILHKKTGSCNWSHYSFCTCIFRIQPVIFFNHVLLIHLYLIWSQPWTAEAPNWPHHCLTNAGCLSSLAFPLQQAQERDVLSLLALSLSSSLSLPHFLHVPPSPSSAALMECVRTDPAFHLPEWERFLAVLINTTLISCAASAACSPARWVLQPASDVSNRTRCAQPSLVWADTWSSPSSQIRGCF